MTHGTGINEKEKRKRTKMLRPKEDVEFVIYTNDKFARYDKTTAYRVFTFAKLLQI